MADYIMICKYFNVSVNELLEMDIYNFRILLINSIYYTLDQTEEGREKLDQYYRISRPADIDLAAFQSFPGHLMK